MKKPLYRFVIVLAAMLVAFHPGASAQGNKSGARPGMYKSPDPFAKPKPGSLENKQQQQYQQNKARQQEQQQAAQKKAAAPVVPKISAADTMNTFYGKVMGRFLDYYSRGLNEKLYLQLDKPYYSAGDSLWFKGYLVNAVTHVPQMPSHFIYVELLDRRDSLITRVKVKADENGFNNALRLEAHLPGGDYLLRAYSLWMLNESSDYHYTRVVRIVNPIDDRLTTHVTYEKQADGQIAAKVVVRGSNMQLLSDARVSAVVNTGGKAKALRLKTDPAGHVDIPFTPGPGGNTIDLTLEDEGKTRNTVLHLPDFTTDYDVQFFPEGGPLLAGVLQRVAFKAVGVNGLSAEVTGDICDEQGNVLSELSETYNGMGYFSLMAEPGKKYYARTRSKEGALEKRFELPATIERGYAVKTIVQRQRLICEVLRTPGMPADSLGILMHSHGRILLAEDYNANQPKAVAMNMLPPGIVHITLLHKSTGEAISERLAFVPDLNPVQATITAGQPSYGPRKKVEMTLRVADRDGYALEGGTYAVSVTDRNSIVWDSLAGDINSYMLLTSDLRGYIEQPGAYFHGDPAECAARLDILMMTQGWRRFDISDVLAGRLATYNIGHEDSQRIKGLVKGFWGNAAKSPTLVLFSPETRFIDMFTLDASNKFTLSGLDFPDSTTFILQAISRGGSPRTTTLVVEPEKFAPRDGYIPPLRGGKLDTPLPDAFFSQARERYYYEGGMRVVDLDAIVVNAAAKPKETSTLYNATPSHTIDSKRLESFQSASIYTVLSMFPGVRVSGTEISIRGSYDPPMIYIDNMQVEPEELEYMQVNEIQNIDLVSGPEAAIFGLGASGGVILITLKTGVDISMSKPPLPSLVHVKNLGYRPAAHFYQPRYDVQEILKRPTPDMRTTILWNPQITTDANGQAQITFYTADTPATYDVILEGITPNGEICRTTTTVERK